MALLADERFATLVDAVANRGFQAILFDRDETDSYRLQLEVLGDGTGVLSRAQILSILPVGSRWAPAVGWSSYVVVPPRMVESSDLALVGLESILPHPSRGAYPIFGGLVVPVQRVADVLAKIADRLDPARRSHASEAFGAIASTAQTPEAHRVAEAQILRSASAAYGENEMLAVRTTLLTEDEVPPAKAALPFSRHGSRGLLLGVVHPLRDHFSKSAKKRLKWLLER